MRRGPETRRGPAGPEPGLRPSARLFWVGRRGIVRPSPAHAAGGRGAAHSMNDVTSREPMAPPEAGPAAETPAAEPAARRPKLRPLLGLKPIVARYKGRVAAALAALLIASVATLAVPVAVRRMIDLGFSRERVGLIDEYCAGMSAVVALLAAASASRYCLGTTLGERVVADLRR